MSSPSVMVPGSARNLWQRLTPNAKRAIVMGSAFVALIIVCLPFSKPPSSGPNAVTSPQSIRNILTGADYRELGLTGVSKDVDELKRRLAESDRTVKQLHEELEQAKKNPSKPEGSAAPSAEVQQLRAEFDSFRDQLGAPAAPSVTPQENESQEAAPQSLPPAGIVRTGTPVDRLPPGQDLQPVPEAPFTIHKITAESEVKVPAGKVKEDAPGVYIPSGSILSGVLLTGLDAPTGRVGQNNPIPALVRIKDLAILPNRYRADVSECFVLMDGIGDISSERAMLRAQSISCVRNDGGVIDTRLEAYGVGEDGSAGLRGIVQSKQSGVIMKATLAGIADGLSKAFGPNLSVVGSSSEFSGANALQAGAAGGASSALDRVAKYYLDNASALLPVVVIHPGRPVQIVVVKGTALKLQKS